MIVAASLAMVSMAAQSQPVAPRVTIEKAVANAFTMGCMLNVLGQMPFNDDGREHLTKLGFAVVTEPPSMVRQMANAVWGRAEFAKVTDKVDADIWLIANPSIRACTILLFNAGMNDASSEMRKTWLGPGTPWVKTRGPERAHMTLPIVSHHYEWSAAPGGGLLSVLTGFSVPSQGGPGLQLMLTIAPSPKS